MKHVKLFEQFLNEANSYYIETWYKDRNSNEVQLLGSDGTTVMKKMPKAGDVDQHANRINSLRKIKPFLVGEVMYRVVGPDGRVHRTINDTIEEGLNEAMAGKEIEIGGVKAERFTTAGINGWKLTVDSALGRKKQIIMVPDSIGKELFDFIVKNS